MSSYDVYAKVTAIPADLKEAKSILERYMFITSNERCFDACWGGDPIIENEKLTCDHSVAIKLISSEISIIKKIGIKKNYTDDLEKIFAARIKADDEDPDDFDVGFFMDSIASGSSMDAFAELDIHELEVEYNIYSSNYIYDGDQLRLPGCIDISERYKLIKEGAEVYFQLISQNKILTIDQGPKNSGFFEVFNFQEIKDLIWNGASEVDGETQTRVVYPTATSAPDSYCYELDIVCREHRISVSLDYRGPENKRLRSKKHFRLFATVTCKERELWSGSSSNKLEEVLNKWYARLTDD